MPQPPLISVVMPVYNAMPYLREAVESILTQTHSHFELIAVDDGSSDASREYLACLTDPRVRVILHQKNQGPGAARNTGMAAATGKYIAFMDSDDISLPVRLEKQVAFLEANPRIALCGCASEIFGERNLISRRITSPFLLKRVLPFVWCFNTHTTMFRRNIDYAPQPDYKYGEDTLFVIRIAMQYPVANLPDVLYRYRTHGASASNTPARPHWERVLYATLIEEHLGFTPTERQVSTHLNLIYWNVNASTLKDIIAYLFYVIAHAKHGWQNKSVTFFYLHYRLARTGISRLLKRLRNVMHLGR